MRASFSTRKKRLVLILFDGPDYPSLISFLSPSKGRGERKEIKSERKKATRRAAKDRQSGQERREKRRKKD